MSKVPFQAVSDYDYKAESEAELTLVAGETYKIIEINESGWYHAQAPDGKSGWVPSNFLHGMAQPDSPATPAPAVSADNEEAKFCGVCSKEVDESFVMAKSQHFHVDCFTCAECKESLAGKGYVERDGKYFCENCYHEKFSPKCGKCEQIIKGQYVSALDQSYHPDCFNCSECDGAFDGDRFRKREQKPYCEDCYAKLFSVTCKKCEKPIQGKVFQANEDHFHEECFICDVDGQKISASDAFHVRQGKIYCVTHYREKFIHQCQGCKEDISGKFVHLLDFYFHEKCWSCYQCKKSLLSGEFRQVDEKFMCPDCAGSQESQAGTTAKATGPPPSKPAGGPPQKPAGGPPQKPAGGPPQKPAGGPPSKPAAGPPRTSPPQVNLLDPEASEVIISDEAAYVPLKQAVEPEADEGPMKVRTKYPYIDLRDNRPNLPKSVNLKELEEYLADDEFESIFKMSRTEFTKLPKWRQQKQKKNVGLF
eukprot:974365_1